MLLRDVNMFKTLLVLIYSIPATIVFGASAALSAFFSKEGNIPHKIAVAWAKSILWVSRVNIKVTGAENIDPEKSYILMANHQSNFDILALFSGLPVQFRWLAKAELFKIPIFSHGMRGCGYISIDRSNREAAFRSIEEAAEKIQTGVSVMIFPEGTRSHNGQLLPFKKGGFVLAVKSKVPIVPMIITGSLSIMPKKKIKIKPGVIHLDILKPVDTVCYDENSKSDLINVIRDRIESELRKKGEGSTRC